MRATIMYKAGDVRIENVPDPKIVDPTDAIIHVTRACICGNTKTDKFYKKPGYSY